MRKIKLLASVVLALVFILQANAQDTKKQSPAEPKRCATMEHLEAYFQENPKARQQADQNMNRSGGSLRTGDTYRLNAIVTIPVVVHVVLPTPNIITDADVNYFINRLNLDYSGLNPDSTNAGAFLPLRGHSQIRFCIARRTPAGQLTTGVERKVSTTGSNVNLAVDPIKRSAQGGLDSWDNTSYLNIWVGNDASNQGILGYATFPGTASAADDGVFLNYQSFANNSCYTINVYNLGRTGSHEVGHFLGLYHIWGDENACTGDDFRQLTGSCLFPTGLFNPSGQGNTSSDIGDTPNQAGATTTCPAGVATDACATTAPGKMYQNYMDYTADACYSMFTNKQVARMEWVVDNCRAGFKTSLGCTPPTGATTLDAAALESVNPGGSEGCPPVSYPSTASCPGSLIPKVRIVNNGLNTINTLTVGYRLNGGTPVTQNLTNLNLAFGATTVISFPAITTAIGQSYSFRYFTTNPNGTNPDQVPANDSATAAVLTVSGPSALPVAQGFEVLPITPWTVVNPNGDFTWVRGTPGRNSAYAAYVDNYNNNFPGRTDDIRSPVVSTPGTDSVVITFDVAHKNYPGFADALQVLITNDCGATFTMIYNKSGATLATAGSSTAAYTTPVTADWRTERVAIGGSLIASGQIQVAFRNVNAYGNNIWLDNINISRKVSRDLSVTQITAPAASICTNGTTVQAVIANLGAEAITSFTAGYLVNTSTTPVTQQVNQTIAPGASATIIFTTPVTGLPTNANTIRVFTANPVSSSGTGDQQTGNDTLTKTFTVAPIFALPLVEGFEAATFPPANWTLLNPNNNITWVRNNHGNNSSWSAFIDNYNYNLPGQTDALQTPALRTTGTDSIVVSFDVAHKNYPGAADILQVLVSTDCGQTFTSYYSKSGATLATAGSSTTNYANPAATDWRRERVSISTTGVASGNVIVKFQNTNAYGNNIFLDNINITPVYRRDIQLLSINQPISVVCATSITPAVTVRNAGIDTITGYKVGYTIDNSTTPVVSTFTGVRIANGATQTITLTPATVAAGAHIITIYTFDPVTAAGTGDGNPTNDTLRKAFAVIGTQAAPLVEGFEATTFPPTGWGVVNPDGALTWQRSTAAARTGNASALMNNYNYAANGTRDDLYTPRVTYNGIDSLFLNFDVAATTYSYPGSTDIPLDTLEVLVTTDCGATFTSIYKKWGNELQTVKDPNAPQTTEFIPTSRSQWRTESLSLPAFVSRSPIQVVFRNTTNFENNIFIDNVNVSTKTLPAQLKDQGYLIYPSPFASTFYIQHYLPPTELRGIAVYNSVGQRVWAKEYGTSGATSLMQVDLSRFANDVYTVVLRYTNRTISQKIIKVN